MIRLHDTAAREKREFVPADPARITMYVCGPTVYDRAHIGNFRPAIVFDVLQRLLRHTYGKDALVYARNITDIDDKIMARATAEGRSIHEIAAEAERWYLEDARALGVEPPDLAPHATEHLPEMIALVQALIERGAAYAAEGHVLFDTVADADYGSLSGRPLDEMIAGARVEVAPYKKNPQDFVLWKPSAEGQAGWDSPWGRGRPGWHLECSAMIEKHLGTTIDIHGGGQDLTFPHHENEAAQSRTAHGGERLANYWLHNGFLSLDREKMSKSLGNVVTVRDLLDRDHRGETIRLAMLTAHYRQPLDWNENLLRQAKATLDRWYRLLEGRGGDAPATDNEALSEGHPRSPLHLRSIRHPRAGGDPATGKAKPDSSEAAPADPRLRADDSGRVDQRFLGALSDDLNSPAAIARLSELAGAGDGDGLAGSAALLGLLMERPADWRTGGVADNFDVAGRIAARAAAKAQKDYAAADRIRDELAAEGVILEDGPQGTTWRRE